VAIRLEWFKQFVASFLKQCSVALIYLFDLRISSLAQKFNRGRVGPSERLTDFQGHRGMRLVERNFHSLDSLDKYDSKL